LDIDVIAIHRISTACITGFIERVVGIDGVVVLEEGRATSSTEVQSPSVACEVQAINATLLRTAAAAVSSMVDSMCQQDKSAAVSSMVDIMCQRDKNAKSGRVALRPLGLYIRNTQNIGKRNT
jgi:hypothetical protein